MKRKRKERKRERKLIELNRVKTIENRDKKQIAGGYDAEGNGVEDAINFLKR